MPRIPSISSVLFATQALLAAALGCAHPAGRNGSLVPGDSVRGLVLFEERGCSNCHRLGGDPRDPKHRLDASGSGPTSEAAILSSLWNHAPLMWSTLEDLGVSPAPLAPAEMADLFALLYYLSILDEQGDPERGRWIFMEKGCDACHAETIDDDGRIGPSLPFWSTHTTPVRLTRAMWSHATKMQERMRLAGIPWTELEGPDMADLVAYVSEVNRIAAPRPLLVGDPVRGRNLFTARRCARCHRTHSDESGIGPSIVEMNGAARTIGELGALMWNHFPRMKDLVGEEGIERFRFSSKEMADLFAYLFSLGYFDESGDPVAGELVFEAKACGDCHGGRGRPGGSLHLTPAQTTGISMASALWNHGPKMAGELGRAGRDWPEISPREAADLLAFLRSRAESP